MSVAPPLAIASETTNQFEYFPRLALIQTDIMFGRALQTLPPATGWSVQCWTCRVRIIGSGCDVVTVFDTR